MAGRGYTSITWEEQNRQLFHALKLERVVTAITIGLIELVGRSEYSYHPDHDRADEVQRHRGADVDGGAARRRSGGFLLCRVR